MHSIVSPLPHRNVLYLQMLGPGPHTQQGPGGAQQPRHGQCNILVLDSDDTLYKSSNQILPTLHTDLNL